MRKTNRLGWKNKTAVLALGLGLFVWGFIMMAIVSHAESQVKVTSPKGANIRKEASSSSERVGGVEKDSVLTVLNQVQGSDGYTWYQVKSGDTTGYIRSDLVEVSEGGTAPSEGGTEGGEGGSGEGAAPVDVMAVNPVSATVSSDSGKIRDTASSEGQILEEVPAETVLTVNGQATDADGRTWYQVSFLSGETEVKGFIRYDYVTLAGELTPLTEEPSDPAPEEPSEPEPSEEEKLYETAFQDGVWLLVDNSLGKGFPIDELFDGVEKNGKLYEDSLQTVKNQKIIIIVLVFLLVAAAAGIAFLVFKVRDMMDSAYFDKMENDVLQKKNAGGQGSRRAMQTVGGGEKPSARQGSGRPASGGQARPAGSQGARPAGSGQARPAGSQGARPAGSSQGGRGAGTGQGTRMTEAPQGGRPASQGQRRAEQPRPAAPQSARPAKPAQTNTQKSQPRNFMEDDDEFDFEFLNYDGDEE